MNTITLELPLVDDERFSSLPIAVEKYGRGRPWLPIEDDFIRANYKTMSASEMSSRLARRLHCVYERKHEIGCVVAGKQRHSRNCKQCGEQFFVVNSSTKIYCGLKCAYASKDRIVERPKDRGFKICPWCGTEWKVTTRKARQEHCSHKCAVASVNAANPAAMEVRECVNCGMKFEIRSKLLRKCCSEQCTNQRKADNSRSMWLDDSRKQRMSDMKTLMHATNPPQSPGWKTRKSGRRADIGKQFFRSAWEANYARYLNFLVQQKNIASWKFEPKTFWFEKIKRGVRSYKPDFEIINVDGSVEYHEVKGYDYPRGKTARKRLAKYYPEVKLVVIDKKQYTAIAKWKFLIANWE